MSKNKHKKEVTNVPENEAVMAKEGETKEMTETGEKKNVFEKIGYGFGKVVGGVSKAATSTPGKIAIGVAAAGALLKAGYELAKYESGSSEDDSTDSEDVVAEDSFNEANAAETEEN